MRLLLFLIVLLVLLLGATVWPSISRFAPSREDILSLGRRTKDLFRMAATKVWSDLPAYQLGKITANAALSAAGTTVSGKIHNGSDWVVRELVVRITVRRKSTRAGLWSRQVRIPDLNIPPSKAQAFSIDVTGAEGPAEIEVKVLSGLGHR